jgi:membrane protease subunit HflK
MSAPEAYKERILARVQDVIDTQGLGVTIQTADITPVPPRQVRQAFLDVVTAGVKRGQAITEANSYASSNLTTAVGEAKSIVDNSETERNQLVQALAADANYFSSQLPHYRSESKLFLARLQTETFQRIFTNAQHKVLRMDSAQRPMRISISPEFEKPRTPPNQRQ